MQIKSFSPLFLTVAPLAHVLLLLAGSGAGTVQAASPAVVVAWGNNTYGQTAVPVGAQSGVIAIATGAGHTLALKNDGSVVAWGWNGYGQTDVPVAAQSGVTAIAAGWYHTAAIISIPVVLQARPNGNEIILSWPTDAVGFTLQSTPSLTPPMTWMDFLETPAVVGSQFVVTNMMGGGAKFYRLRKP